MKATTNPGDMALKGVWGSISHIFVDYWFVWVAVLAAAAFIKLSQNVRRSRAVRW
jgi:hypothetical protein